mgnify:CR=1 FL=1
MFAIANKYALAEEVNCTFSDSGSARPSAKVAAHHRRVSRATEPGPSAGVPSASLVAIAIILSAVGLPLEALGVLLVFDRILDMARTSVNVWGDCSCATIVARLSGEETKVALNPESAGRG